jgi:hypothetical protein
MAAGPTGSNRPGRQNPAYRPHSLAWLSPAENNLRSGEGMQDRLSQNDVTNRVNVEDAARVREAVLAIYSARYPGASFTPLERGFADFQALFEGRYPGYLACDTLYHDMRHTLDMTLAMARLVDGYERSCAAADRLGPRRAVLGVLIALLHDSGYLKRASEAAVENGAVFTKTHVSRGADFISGYLPGIGFGAETALAARLVHFTGYEMEIDEIRVEQPKDRLVGCLVGTADLLGQMSDRLYLEKCREFLYKEFVWGKVARERLPGGHELVRYASPEDLIIKTPGFYEYVARTRMQKKLASVDRYAEAHFDGPNLYQAEIDRNMNFLREMIETADFSRLRRTCYSLSASTRRAA